MKLYLQQAVRGTHQGPVREPYDPPWSTEGNNRSRVRLCRWDSPVSCQSASGRWSRILLTGVVVQEAPAFLGHQWDLNRRKYHVMSDKWRQRNVFAESYPAIPNWSPHFNMSHLCFGVANFLSPQIVIFAKNEFSIIKYWPPQKWQCGVLKFPPSREKPLRLRENNLTQVSTSYAAKAVRQHLCLAGLVIKSYKAALSSKIWVLWAITLPLGPFSPLAPSRPRYPTPPFTPFKPRKPCLPRTPLGPKSPCSPVSPGSPGHPSIPGGPKT